MPQNHHRIKSEYAKSYKIFSDAAQSEYSKNVEFRLARRNQEVSHQPWAWLDVDLSEDESDSIHITNSTSNVLNQNAIEINDSNSNETNSNFDASGVVDKSEEDNQLDEQNLIQQLKKKAIKRAMELNTEQKELQHNQSNSLLRRPHHPLKGNSRTFQNSSNTTHQQNKANCKPANNLCSINRDKMFLSYGWGSKSSESNRKKTFNIKSEIDVYPSAIRALKTRETVKQQKNKSNGAEVSNRPKTAIPGKASHPNSSRRSIDLNNRAAMEWLSEYQCRFPIYDNEVYRRGLANLAPRGQFARLETPRTCRI